MGGQPAGWAGERLTNDAAFAQAVAADEDEETKMPRAKAWTIFSNSR
jgi:hypothetical protein